MPEWKDLIAIRKKTFQIKKGKHLFREGEKVNGIFFIYSGAVKIVSSWPQGKEVIIRFARAGEIAGHRGLGGADVYPITATALEDTTACFITNEFLELSIKANPSLTYTLMQFYAVELQSAERRMRDLTHLDVKGRIAGALLEIARIFGEDKDQYLDISLTRQDIASYAGTTYETVFKHFTEWIGLKIISTKGKSIRIHQPGELRRFTG
jgi:CRP/FNR family transcriptional regulator